MKIDEQIKILEDNAEYIRKEGDLQGCLNFRQLAEWLKDYKRLLEQEPKTGHWIEVTNGRGGHECNICHEYAPSYQNGDEYLTDYCPNCGCRMIEPQESEE